MVTASLGSMAATTWPVVRPASVSVIPNRSALATSSPRETSVPACTPRRRADLPEALPGSRIALQRKPIGCPLVGERLRAFVLVGVAPHRRQMLGTLPAGIGQAVLERPPESSFGGPHRGR